MPYSASHRSSSFSDFVKKHAGYTVISYVNTSAATKALTDVVVTSSNARQIVESFPEDTPIIFGPDQNLEIEATSLKSPALAGRFFTTSTTCEV